MENIFDMPILEQMYSFRKEDIEQTIYDNNKEIREIEDKVCEASERISDFVKRLTSNEEELKKIGDLMRQYELNFGDEVYFWSKAYYKLGLNDMYKLKCELKSGISINKGDTFLDYTDAELDEYIQRKINFNSETYKEYKAKCRELEEKYPRVLEVFENSTPIVLNEEEMIKLMEIKELDARVRAEEVKVCFKAGINEVLNF